MKKYLTIVFVLPFIFSLAQEQEMRDQRLFLMPTGATLPADTSFFTDIELFIIGGGHGFSSNIMVEAYSIFPITFDLMKTITFAGKYGVYSSPDFAGAVNVSYNPYWSLYSVGASGSYYIGSTSFHGSVGYWNNGEDDDIEDSGTWMFHLGIKAKSFIAEVIGISNKDFTDDEIAGAALVGVRIKGLGVEWDFAGIRPFANSGDLFFFPYVKGTFYF